MNAILLSLVLMSDVEITVDQVETAVEMMLKTGIDEHDLSARPGHPILIDAIAMRNFALAVLDASERHQVPPFLLVAIAVRENSLLTKPVGKLGETSMFQMTPGFVRLAKRLDTNCDAESVPGSARCAAVMLAKYRSECGTWQGAISRYATGKRCSPANRRVDWIIRDRIGIAIWLQNHSTRQ